MPEDEVVKNLFEDDFLERWLEFVFNTNKAALNLNYSINRETFFDKVIEKRIPLRHDSLNHNAFCSENLKLHIDEYKKNIYLFKNRCLLYRQYNISEYIEKAQKSEFKSLMPMIQKNILDYANKLFDKKLSSLEIKKNVFGQEKHLNHNQIRHCVLHLLLDKTERLFDFVFNKKDKWDKILLECAYSLILDKSKKEKIHTKINKEIFGVTKGGDSNKRNKEETAKLYRDYMKQVDFIKSVQNKKDIIINMDEDEIYFYLTQELGLEQEDYWVEQISESPQILKKSAEVLAKEYLLRQPDIKINTLKSLSVVICRGKKYNEELIKKLTCELLYIDEDIIHLTYLLNDDFFAEKILSDSLAIKRKLINLKESTCN